MVEQNPQIEHFVTIERETTDGKFEQVWSSRNKSRLEEVPKEFRELPMFGVIVKDGVEIRKIALSVSGAFQIDSHAHIARGPFSIQLKLLLY